MAGVLIETVRTPLTAASLASAICREWRTLWQAEPSPEAVACLVGQAHQETGYVNCWCWNWGNVRAFGSQDYCVLRGAWEIDASGQRVDDPQGHFRAFRSLGEANVAQLRLLSSAHYADAWSGVLRGDPFAFVHGLREGGYFTGPEPAYLRGVCSAYDAQLETLDVTAALAQLGYDDVTSFQAAMGLTADGMAGPMTRSRLRVELGAA